MAFNKLTDAEAERLAILAEECAEVIQVVGKILRHGYASCHPDNLKGETNRRLLERELGDVLGTMRVMEKRGDVGVNPIREHAMQRQFKFEKGTFLHHQL